MHLPQITDTLCNIILCHYACREIDMNNKSVRIIVGTISVAVSLFLAWRIGLWLEPAPTQKGPKPMVTTANVAKSPPFASGKASEQLTYELHRVRQSEDGKIFDGIGLVRFDIRQEQLKPIVLSMLAELYKKIPREQQVHLFIRPSLDCTVCTIAEVSSQQGKTVIKFGIPSLAQIYAHNARIGVASPSGEKIDLPRLYLPDRESFSGGLAVVTAMDAARKKSPSLTDDQLLEQAAAATGVSYVVARKHLDFMRAYFTGDSFGSETFQANLR